MYIITSSQEQLYSEEAIQLSRQLGIPYVPRKKIALEHMMNTYKAEAILVLQKQGPALYTGQENQHLFHLSMAQLRILQLSRGKEDHAVTAIGTHTQRLLDATLGLGADSAVISYGLPQLTYHLGIEAHPLLAYITNEGFRHYEHNDETITKALRRIQVAHMTYQELLPQLETNAFDTIYFDPMFEEPVWESPQFQTLRSTIRHEAFSESTLREALRVAPRVVVKERRHSSLFKRMPPATYIGGKYSKITYGIYTRGES